MPEIDEDDRPKKKITHEIGQDLTCCQSRNCTNGSRLLRDEIARLEADIGKKQASRKAADQFFKK